MKIWHFTKNDLNALCNTFLDLNGGLTREPGIVTCDGCKGMLTAPGGPQHRATHEAQSQNVECVYYQRTKKLCGPGCFGCGRGLKHDAGVKDDHEKPRFALLPFGALGWVAKVMTYGAKKYEAWNWITLENAEERYASAMLRHYTAWQQGEMLDEESGLPHVAHLATDALFLCAFVLGTDGTKKKENE